MSDPVRLRRALSLPMLTLYGVGTMVGGGFYALVGKVAGLAGMQAPFAFVLSAVLALFSALSFAELASRFPYSGGPARYVEEVFGVRWLAIAIGWVVIGTGVISAATLADAVVGFVQDLAPVPTNVGIVVVLALLTAVAMWGIGESAKLAVAITLLETGGLIFVIATAGEGIATVPDRVGEMLPSFAFDPMIGVALGAFLAFYSFVGFEDLVTVAEEVHNPRQTLPRAILLSLGITTMLYVAVVLAAVTSVPLSALAEAHNPLVTVIAARGITWTQPLVVVSVLAGVNGALVQLVMGSRVLYGLADQEDAPALFARVHPRTRTPLWATALVGCVTVLLAVALPLLTLARATSLLLLVVFTVVNLCLLTLKRRRDRPPAQGPSYPTFVPAVGAVLAAGFVVVELLRLVGGIGS